MVKRILSELIISRINEKKPLIQVILGPRQIGKTTALKTALHGRGIYETADSPAPLPATVIVEWWNQAIASQDRILAIDEVQKIRGWSEVIKKKWDESPHALKLLLTGSSSLLMEKGLKETLAGRFELIRAEHWNFQEATEIFSLSLEKFIEFGCYPGSIPLLADVERWAHYIRDSIVEPVLGRDLLQLHPVEQPALLRQIFGVVVSLPAQLVSLHKLQGQLQGKGTLPTLQHYLHLLSEAFLISVVQKFNRAPFKTRKSIPKFIIHDNGLLRAFERPITEKLNQDRFGHYFENIIGARFIEAGWETYYWKDKNHEVDFVVKGPQGENLAIEVKSSFIEKKNIQGLFEFCKIHKDFEPCLISLVGQKLPEVRNLDPKEILSLTRLRKQSRAI